MTKPLGTSFPERTRSGVVWNQCAHNERRVFASRENLWRDHLFEPLLRWVNDKHAPIGSGKLLLKTEDLVTAIEATRAAWASTFGDTTIEI